jgi:hypothetical protein
MRAEERRGKIYIIANAMSGAKISFKMWFIIISTSVCLLMNYCTNECSSYVFYIMLTELCAHYIVTLLHYVIRFIGHLSFEGTTLWKFAKRFKCTQKINRSMLLMTLTLVIVQWSLVCIWRGSLWNIKMNQKTAELLMTVSC